MIRRLVRYAFRSQGSNQLSGWFFASAALFVYDLLSSRTGRQELIDVSDIKPGETIVITALDISHKDQIKQFKKDQKKADREAKQAKKQQKAKVRTRAKEVKSDSSGSASEKPQRRRFRR